MDAYKKIEERYIDEVNSTCSIYLHIKTKAKICTIKNDDRNKVFSIAFRTPAINSSGLTHILEHSVLCGSKKYPVKDPFVELMKSSLNTFLNAFTFPDKTVYPLASLNLDDFHNLMDIYLNSVFYPKIYENKEIFMQEGWHYEIEDINSPIKYNGVVYNEMKGAFSDPEEILQREVLASLFPNTSYHLESGGDPKYIPDLSYEEFIEFHKKYYHPSNSYIYLYGDLDMESELDYIDKEYLSKFEYDDFDTKIKYQNPFRKIKEKEIYFESEDNNAFLSYNVAFPTTLDNKLMLAVDILTTALLYTPGAPLKEALIKANLGDSIESSFDDGLLQPILSIYATNSKLENEEKFINLINEKLTEFINGKLDHKAIAALIKFFEFKAREKSFSASMPKGLTVNIDVLSSWLYDDNKPFSKLEELKYYEELLEDLNNNYFEDIIDKYILNNKHKSYVKLIGKPGIQEKEETKIKNKLSKYKESLTLDELKNLVNDYQKLKIYQMTDSTKEELDTLPKLKLDSIDLKPLDPKLECLNNDYEVLFSDYKINGITYATYYFDISKLNFEDLKYVSLFTKLFIHFSTKNHTYVKLNELIQLYTGGISSAVKTYIDKDNNVRIQLCFTYSALKQNISLADSLLKEMIFDRIYDKKRLKELLIEISTHYHNSLASAASSVAIARALSYIDEASFVKDEAIGLNFIYFIDDLIKNFSKKYEYIVEKLTSVGKYLSKSNFTLGVTTSRDDYEMVKDIFHNFYLNLNDNLNYEKYEFIKDIKNEGLTAPFDVNFNAFASVINYEYKGYHVLASNIINNNYLWPKVRVLGGAYGAGMSFGDNGIYTIYSYRDPHVKKTFDAFKGIEEFLENLEISDEELESYKIGALGSMQAVLHPKALAILGRSRYFAGKTVEDSQRLLDEIINAKLSDVKETVNIVRKANKNNVICSIGPSKRLRNTKNIFKVIRKAL